MYQQKKETLAPFHIKSALKMDSLYKIVVEEPAVSFKKYTEKIMVIKLNKSTYISINMLDINDNILLIYELCNA